MKVQNKSLGINAFLNVIRSSLSVVFPLITYPYAFRTLHAENMGKIDFSNSIISYFSLIAVLGVSSYAVREGAKVRDDKEKIDKLSSEIFSINIVTTVISYSLLFLFVMVSDKIKPYSGLIFLMSFSIAFTTLGIDWINTIYEDFLFITVRSIVTHVLSLALLFALVKHEDDYYIYAFLSVLTNIVVSLSNWFYCRKYVHIKFTVKMNARKHLKYILVLFANTLATSIYVNSGTTLLGWMTGDYYVGLLGIATRIYNVMKNMLAALYTVAIPRIAFYVGCEDIRNLKNTYSKLLSLVTLILVPASAGMCSISKEIIFLIGGQEYRNSVITLQLFCLALVGAVFGGIISYCLNIPIGREKVNVKATTMSACLNICLNVLLIPYFKQNGVAIATCVSEFFVFLYCLLKCHDIDKYIDIRFWMENLLHAGIGVAIIFGISFVIHSFNMNIFISLGTIILLSVAAYLAELFILKNKIMMNLLEEIVTKRKSSR